MEWVADWFSPSYYGQDGVSDDPTGPAGGATKVEKGGWWGAVPYVARSAYRHFEDPPTYQDHHIGARIVTEGDPPA
jgi:formylglycine-generating enzyme required for sulfatase activity